MGIPNNVINLGDRRRAEREPRTETLIIQYLDKSLETIRKESARTENISRQGARLLVRSAPRDIERVKVTNREHQFESTAVVRNRYVGSDGVERLCVRFIDRDWID